MHAPRFPRLLSAASLSLAAAGATAACGVAPAERTGESTGAIVNGTPTTDALGSVMLWQCTQGAASCCPNGAASCSTASASYDGGCSATMVADRWLLTAHHCATNEVVTTGGTPIPAWQLVAISADRASYASGDQVFLHPTLDVALVHLSSSVVNSQDVALSTPIFQGTSASRIGSTVYCQGFGNDSISPPPYGSGYGTLRSAFLHVNNATPGWVALDTNSAQQTLYYGDSGTACFLYAPGAGSPNAVYAVQSWSGGDIGNGIPSVDDLVGADGFASWAAGVVNGDACQLAGLSCGTTTDAFGATAQCGTCGAGDVCQRGTCVCAPQTCRAPLKWSQADCACELPCNSPRTCCIAAGGDWNGHSCE